MRYADIKRAVLSHINQYTMVGSPVAPSYNNQADYLNRIPTLMNEALVNIRTFVKPLPVVYDLVGGEEYGDYMRYELPSDFWSLRSGGVTIIRDGHYMKTNNYHLQGAKYILVPEGDCTIEYYRYPELLPMDGSIPDDYEVNEDLEVLQTATYYVSAYLVLQEDEFAYAQLYNDYESRLARIAPRVTVENIPIKDVFFDWRETV